MILYNGDCIELMKGMESGIVDLVITDCPYKIVSGGCATVENRLGGCLSADASTIPTTYVKEGKLFKHTDIKFSSWLPEVYRVLKDGTHCYIMINPRNLKELWEEAENAGFVFQQLLVWDKGNVTPNKWYMNAYELILMLRKGKARTISDKGEKNILRVPNVIRSKAHPTEKPVELMEILVRNSSKEGELVFDPFMGVGGVGVASRKLGREFIGAEIDEKYYRVAEDRINGVGEQISIEDLMKMLEIGE